MSEVPLDSGARLGPEKDGRDTGCSGNGPGGHVPCDPTHGRSPEESGSETGSGWWSQGLGRGESALDGEEVLQVGCGPASVPKAAHLDT